MWYKIKEIIGMVFNINPFYIGKKRYIEKLIKESEIKKDLESMNILSKFNQFKNRRIVCLCGSTRFKEVYEKANREESAKGRIVLTVAMYGHLEGLNMDSHEKRTFDEVHYDKILLADEILVLNVNKYIGLSTYAEIQFAVKNNRRVRFLEEFDGMDMYIENIRRSNTPTTTAIKDTEAYFKTDLNSSAIYKRTDDWTNKLLSGGVVDRIYCYQFLGGEVFGIIAFDNIYQSVYNVYTPKG
jgi:hypothetical protein